MNKSIMKALKKNVDKKNVLHNLVSNGTQNSCDISAEEIAKIFDL